MKLRGALKAVVFVVAIGAVVIGAAVAIRRSRSGDGAADVTAPAGVVVGEGADVPLLLDGDRLGLASLVGGAPVPVTPPGIYSDVHFDPAGRIVYFQRSGHRPGFYRIEAGRPRLVIAVPSAVPWRAAWAPDATRAAWIAADGKLRIAEPDAAPIVVPSDVAGFLWSPDSAWLMAWKGGAGAVLIVDARDGSTTPTSALPPESWSSTGDIASLESPASGDPFRPTLVFAHEDGTARRSLGDVRLPPEGRRTPSAFSPDGRWLAWTLPDDSMVVTEIATGIRTTPSCPACVGGSMGYRPAWSPGGGPLAWSQDGHVVVARAGEWSGAIVADGSFLSWSPDGSAVAYLRQTDGAASWAIYARPLAGGAEALVASLLDTFELPGQVAWSPDGRQMVVPLQVEASMRAYAFNPATGGLRNFPISAPIIAPPLLSPDGSAFYDGENVVRLGIGSRAFGALQVTGWSGDGQRVLVVAYQRLSQFNVATGAETKLLDGNVQDAAWSPDERRVAFVRDQRLGVLDIASGKITMIAPDLWAQQRPDGSAAGYLGWSADGSRIVFSAWRDQDAGSRAHDTYLVAPDGGHLSRLIESTDARYYKFAPDGRHLAYLDDLTGDIDVIDLKTKSRTVLGGIANGQPTFVWAGSGALLADDPSGIVLVELDGSRSLLVSDTGSCQRRLIGWTGTEVIFTSICSHEHYL